MKSLAGRPGSEKDCQNPSQRKGPLTNAVIGLHKRGRRDSNPQPLDRQTTDAELQTLDIQHVASPSPPVCTRVCTSKPENANDGLPKAASPNVLPVVEVADGNTQDQVDRGEHRADGADPLAKLAADLLTLSPAERERLAAMLSAYADKAKGEGGAVNGETAS